MGSFVSSQMFRDQTFPGRVGSKAITGPYCPQLAKNRRPKWLLVTTISLVWLQYGLGHVLPPYRVYPPPFRRLWSTVTCSIGPKSAKRDMAAVCPSALSSLLCRIVIEAGNESPT